MAVVFDSDQKDVAKFSRKKLRPTSSKVTLRQAAFRSWNDYVSATEAFLQHDLSKLREARERLDPDNRNLKIVDSFIAHFDDSYAKAYATD